MAMNVITGSPAALLAKIKQAIDNREIETWSYDSDGDFTHTPDQWKLKAWMRPALAQGLLNFGILGNTGVPMTKVLYGVYHGRFLEMLATHFDDDFVTATVTAAKTSPDNFK